MVVDSGNTPPLVAFLAGGAAGGVESAVTYPFEFAKTRMQLRSEGNAPRTKNPFLVVRHVIQNEGVRALYKGVSTLIVGTIAKDAIRFLSFDTIKTAFKDPETGILSPMRSLGAGMASGVVSSIFAVTPSERIKTALIDDAKTTRRFRSAPHCIRTLIAEQGPGALYRGFVSTTMKQASTTAVRLGTYDILKDFWKTKNVDAGLGITLLNGAIAGTTVVFTTQPFDVVKTRAQSIRGEGIFEATRNIMLESGVKGFWSGSTMRLGRTVLAGAILFSAYEEFVVLFKPLVERTPKLIA